MMRLRDALVPLLGDARHVLAMLCAAALFVLCIVGRAVVAVVLDVREAGRRLAG